MRIAFELASDADSKLAARVWNLLFHMHSMGSKIIPGMPVCYKAEGCEIKPWSCHSKITKRNLENAGQAEKSNGAKWSALMEDFLEKCTLIRIMRIMIEKLFPLCRTRHRRDIGFNTAEEIERAGLFTSTCDREGALSWGNKHKCACVRVGGHRVREALKKNPKKTQQWLCFDSSAVKEMTRFHPDARACWSWMHGNDLWRFPVVFQGFICLLFPFHCL